MIKKHKLEFLGLVETKISGERVHRICRKLKFEAWIWVEAIKFSGGI